MSRRSTLTTISLVVLIFAAATTSLLASHRGIGTAMIYTSPEALQDAQRILERARYLAPGSYVTGKKDAPTREAIRLFQEDHFIRATSQLDHETVALLTSHGAGLDHSARIPEQRGATELLVRALQGRYGEALAAAAAKPVEVAGADVEAASTEKTLTPDLLTKVEEIAARMEPEPESESIGEGEEATAKPQAARQMPATASPTAMMAAAGSLLAALGIALVSRRRR